jgi:hypothetical protein
MHAIANLKSKVNTPVYFSESSPSGEKSYSHERYAININAVRKQLWLWVSNALVSSVTASFQMILFLLLSRLVPWNSILIVQQIGGNIMQEGTSPVHQVFRCMDHHASCRSKRVAYITRLNVDDHTMDTIVIFSAGTNQNDSTIYPCHCFDLGCLSLSWNYTIAPRIGEESPQLVLRVTVPAPCSNNTVAWCLLYYNGEIPSRLLAKCLDLWPEA